MARIHPQSVKQNVQRFDEDVRESGGYAYTGNRLSARLANERITRGIAESFDFRGKSVIDIGCGDGAYTVEFPSLGVRKILGIDPAAGAVEAARNRARKLDVSDLVSFEIGDIYALDEYLLSGNFACSVIRGVLHHLPDAARAIAGLSKFEGTIVILEPNGNNPVLKVLERFSKYHVEHEERSFSPSQICGWLTEAGFKVQSSDLINLVPMFCPDMLAKLCRGVEPLVERIPLIRDIACGQSIIVASK